MRNSGPPSRSADTRAPDTGQCQSLNMIRSQARRASGQDQDRHGATAGPLAHAGSGWLRAWLRLCARRVAAHPHKWRVLVQRDLASRLIAAYSRPGRWTVLPVSSRSGVVPAAQAGGGRRACRSVRASEITAHAASVTNSSMATSLRAPAAAESGKSCAMPQAVNARTAISRMKPCRRLGGCAMLTAAIAPATSSSGAAEAPAWWAQRTLPPIPSAVTSKMLPVMEIRPSPMATKSRTCGVFARCR